MMFTASNGMRVERDGEFVFTPFGRIYPDDAQALKEFFQHERDAELGRWRWPENPDYVVYAKPDDAFTQMFGPDLDLVILRESDGMTKGYVQIEDDGGKPMAHRTGHILAARAYFEAHPAHKPRDDAKEGEVWVLDLTNGQTHPAIFQADMFRDTGGAWSNAEIKSARRIWPES